MMDQALLSCKTWGDNIIPCPREFHEKFTRGMICVWEIDVGVILNLGFGKSLLALILENRRAVAIVKNKANRNSTGTTCHMRSIHRVWHHRHGQPIRNS